MGFREVDRGLVSPTPFTESCVLYSSMENLRLDFFYAGMSFIIYMGGGGGEQFVKEPLKISSEKSCYENTT